MKAFADELRPLLAAGQQLDDERDGFDRALTAIAAGDTSPFEDTAINAQSDAVRAFAADVCDFHTVDVRARDFTFAMPATAKAGRTLLRITNEGHQPHVLLSLRRDTASGPTDDELVGQALAGEVPEGIQVTPGGPFAPPGASGLYVLDLVAGTYVAFCPIPSGDDGNGPPHHALGMLQRIEVAK